MYDIVVTLCVSAGLNIFLMATKDSAPAKTNTSAAAKTTSNSYVETIIITCYELMLAGLIFLSMSGHEQVLFYFGFLRGKISKAIFLLFVATVVFNAPDNDEGWIKDIVGGFLTLCAVL